MGSLLDPWGHRPTDEPTVNKRTIDVVRQRGSIYESSYRVVVNTFPPSDPDSRLGRMTCSVEAYRIDGDGKADQLGGTLFDEDPIKAVIDAAVWIGEDHQRHADRVDAARDDERRTNDRIARQQRAERKQRQADAAAADTARLEHVKMMPRADVEERIAAMRTEWDDIHAGKYTGSLSHQLRMWHAENRALLDRLTQLLDAERQAPPLE